MRKYPITINGKKTKIYAIWHSMVERCLHKGRFSPDSNKHQSYNDASICEEWLDYDTFYEWCISQENYDVWKDLPRSAIDKDIKDYGNKLYCPGKCLLVPQVVNGLLVNNYRYGKEGKPSYGYPNVNYEDKNIKRKNKFRGQWSDRGRNMNTPFFATADEAYLAVKPQKENTVHLIAQEEYDKGTISSECYDILMAFEMPTLEEIKRNLEIDFDYER